MSESVSSGDDPSMSTSEAESTGEEMNLDQPPPDNQPAAKLNPDPLAGQGEDITPNKDGGVLKAVRKEGEGDEMPLKADNVKVHYVGTLLDGTKFDSSRDRRDYFTFKLGEGQVIKGWDMGVATMKVGEICVLTCRPEYAYGKSAKGKIPPNSTLVFEVELIGFEGEDLSKDKDRGIMCRVLKASENYTKPSEESTIKAHLIGSYEDNVFEERDVEFSLGEGEDVGIISGVEQAFYKMKKGETTKLTISPKYAFGSEGNAEFKVPPDATVEYEVELTDFEKSKESWEMDSNEKLEQSELAKTRGTAFFKEANYPKAVRQYNKLVSYLEHETDLKDEQEEQRRRLVLAAHLNLAMCHLKTGDYISCTQACDKALNLDDKNIKALFRRGEAYMGQKSFDLAKQDFDQLLGYEPDNKAAKNKLALAKHHIKQFKEREKKIYSNMFSKFAEQDAKVKEAKKNQENKVTKPLKISQLDEETKESGDGDGKMEDTPVET